MSDSKDWTWVLQRACADCGFDPAAVIGPQVPSLLTADARRWAAVLSRPDATERPAEGVWSPLEYSCHVRDVCRVFAQRTRLMLSEQDPTFANWDQDEAAVTGGYADQEPAAVSAELTDAAAEAASVFGSVGPGQWGRTGRRSDGMGFTVETLGRYFVHELVHHLHDVHG